MRRKGTDAAAKLEVQRELPVDLLLRACGFLPPNEIPCTARLICKASALHFSTPHHRTVHLGQPVPPQAFAARYGRGADPQPLRQLSLYQKERLLALTASTGVLKNVATLAERMELPFCWKVPRIGLRENDACAAAARNGHMHVVRFLLEREIPLDLDAVTPAVLQHCDLDDVQWLLGHEAWRDSAIVEGELTEGDLRAAASSTVPNPTAKLEWLQGREWSVDGEKLSGPGLLRQIAKAAADGDNLLGLQWALGRIGVATANMHRSLLSAAACGHALVVTAWLLEQEGAAAAADAAALEAVQLEHGNAAGVLRLLLPRALEKLRAREGRERFLKECFRCAGYWQLEAALHVAEVAAAHGLEEAAPQDADLAARALEDIAGVCGRVEEARRLWGRHMIPSYAAAARGAVLQAIRTCNMPVLEFLVDEAGVPWEEGPRSTWQYLQAAAVSGAEGEEVVAMLQWLRARGCPLAWSSEHSLVPFIEALEGGRVAVLRWMLSNAMSLENLTGRGCRVALQAAVRGGCEAAAEWLLAAGCPTDEDGEMYLFAAKNGDLDMLRCLRRLGVPWGPNTVLRAVEKSDSVPVHVVGWMVNEGGAPCDERAVKAAPVRSGLRALLRGAVPTAAKGAAKGSAAKKRKGRRRT